jgi:hypothetical protein
MELDNVFTSFPKSVHGVISETGVCYYMPAYQRKYSWSKDNVRRLMNDIRSGVESLHKSEEAITFLGALLTVSDSKGDSVEPKVKEHLPTLIRLVIDGQQRLTTILLLCTVLYDRIALIQSNLKKKCKSLTDLDDEHKNETLLEQIDRLNQLLSKLKSFVYDSNSTFDEDYRYYPKVARGLEDCWSSKPKNAKYVSPLACFLFEFNKHVIRQLKNDQYQKFDFSTFKADNFDSFQANLLELEKIAKEIEKGICWSEDDVVDITSLDCPNYQKILKFELRAQYLDEELSKGDFLKSLYLQLFSSYFLERVCVTSVTVSNENYAFDMFEALNTTGEPLTAYETFRPKVIEYIKNDNGDLTHPDLEGIDKYLDDISKSKEKQDKTQQMIEPFSYIQQGRTCGRHIREQRKYLIESFKKAEDKYKYLSLLKSNAEFIFNTWFSDSIELFDVFKNDNYEGQAKMSLELLRDTGHDITRGLLVYFYHHCKNNNFKDFKPLLDLVKALASFWCIRRSCTNGTAGIDAVYKRIYLEIAKDFGDFESKIEYIKQEFRADLFKLLKVDNFDMELLKSTWIREAKTTPMYKTGKQIGICRFILLSSFHNSIVNKSANILEKGKNDVMPFLCMKRWQEFTIENADQFTIEHIAPQTFKDSEWDSSLEANNLTDTIGNLVILPRGINSQASNKDWHAKRELYKKLFDGSATSKFNEYLPFIEPLASHSGLWKRDTVIKRAENLLDLAWDNIYPWLQ